MDWKGGDVSVAQLRQVISASNLALLLDVSERLRQRHLSGSSHVAEATVKTLRSVVATSKFWDVERLILIIRISGRFLQQAQPMEPVVGNMTLRVLALLREELTSLDTPVPLPTHSHTRSVDPTKQAFTTRGLLSKTWAATSSAYAKDRTAGVSAPTSGAATPLSPQPAESKPDYGTLGSRFLIDPAQPSSNSVSEESGSEAEDETEGAMGKARRGSTGTRGIAHQLKPVLAEMVQEMLDELEVSNANLSKLAKQQIHSGETVLTLGRSKAVEAFLKAAAKERTFTVIVPESSPSFWGHATAANLAKSGINTLLLSDASMYAWLPKVSKVVLGAHYVLANGGAVVEAGGRLLASAAKIHAKPFTLVTGTYKICPNWERAFPSRGPADLAHNGQQTHARSEGGPLPYVPAALEMSAPPGQACPLDEKVTSRVVESLEIVAPMYDFVPPDMISAVFTNMGGFPTSHVSRLVKDQYVEEDVHALA